MNIYKFTDKHENDSPDELYPDDGECARSALDLFPMRAALGLYTLPPRSAESVFGNSQES
ncbi:MAG: hypothetical protein J6A83_02145 [Clostridia bacterium]|nr:hypothetical protein [Clostridia bacterium]